MIDSTPWAGRYHPGPPTIPLHLTTADRHELEQQLAAAGKVQKRVLVRAQALLLMADGVSPVDVAKLLGLHERSVRRLKQRFNVNNPLERLMDAPRTGRPPSLSRKPNARRS